MRVPRTFVFADLSEFTRFTDQQGDEAAGLLLARFRAITRATASEWAVRVAKWLGDGCMVVSVDRHAAISFSLVLEERATDACAPLGLRQGIASGRALLFEGDDYIGMAVNLAARLCDAADPGEILLPVGQAGDLPPGVSWTPHRPLQLHGLPAQVEVVTLRGTPAPRRIEDTGELWTRSPFLA